MEPQLNQLHGRGNLTETVQKSYNSLENQFNAAEEYARQEYMRTVGQLKTPRNPNGLKGEAQGQSHNMAMISQGIASSLINGPNGRFTQLDNHNIPRAMEYINDTGSNPLAFPIPHNAVPQNPYSGSTHLVPTSERRLNQDNQIKNIGVDVDPRLLQQAGCCSRFGLFSCFESGKCCNCFEKREGNVKMVTVPSIHSEPNPSVRVLDGEENGCYYRYCSKCPWSNSGSLNPNKPYGVPPLDPAPPERTGCSALFPCCC